MSVLKARIGGQFVPLSDNGNVWDVGWGIVAMGSPIDNIISLSAPPGEWLTNQIDFKGLLGRRYAIKYQTRAISGVRNGVTTTSPGSSTTGHVDLWLDGALVSLGDSWFEAEMSYGGRPFEWVFTGDGNAHSYRLRGVLSGPGSLQFHNQPTAGNAYYYIEDMGPTASAPVQSLVTPWTNAALLNGWTQSGGWQTVQYRKVGDMVHIRGSATGGPATSGSVVLNLPAGFRPPAQLSFPTEGGANFRWFLINSSGDLMWYSPATITADTSSFHLNHQFSVTP